MKNTKFTNYGQQTFTENNYYDKKEKKCPINDLVEKPKKLCGILGPVIAGIVSVLADIITIWVGLNQIKQKGLFPIIFEQNNKMVIYIIVLGILILITFYIFISLFRLLAKKAERKYILKNNTIYKFETKKCPICGNERKGKVRVKYDENGNAIVRCSCDPSHSWNIPYHEIMKMV